MLVLVEKNSGIEHEFLLTSLRIGANVSFELTSVTLPGLDLNFTLQIPHTPLPIGYTVTVHLFKNPFHLQAEIVDLRIRGLADNSGKVGYFFRLDALFDPHILQQNRNTYPYAYYAIEYLFSKGIAFQTKTPLVDSVQYSITDFFDEDTIILVLCEQYCEKIPEFNIQNYLANIFLFGFTSFSAQKPIERINLHHFIDSKYSGIKTIVRPDGVYVMRIEAANEVLKGDSYITHVFASLIQKEMDYVTRFLMLYQIIEIFISKVLPYEIRTKVCGNLSIVTPSKLKEELNDLTNASNIITSIFHHYARPTEALKIELRQKILDFFIHIQHPEYIDHAKHPGMTATQLFYALRNKLVHEYREWHKATVDQAVTFALMKEINDHSEVMIADMLTNSALKPIP